MQLGYGLDQMESLSAGREISDTQLGDPIEHHPTNRNPRVFPMAERNEFCFFSHHKPNSANEQLKNNNGRITFVVRLG